MISLITSRKICEGEFLSMTTKYGVTVIQLVLEDLVLDLVQLDHD